MSARDTVEGIVRDALVAAERAGTIQGWVIDTRERSLEVAVMEPGLGVHHHHRLVTIEIYEEHHP